MHRLLRVSFLICLALLGFGALSSLHAQNTTWVAWLYNPSNGEMTQIDGDGYILDQIELPLPRGYNFYPFNVAVSSTGSRVAYVGSSSIDDERRLFIYNAITNDVVGYALPDVIATSLDFEVHHSQVFNDNGTALAIGYAPVEGGWQLHLVDVESGLASLVLRREMAGDSVPDTPGLIPVVRQVAGDSVWFALVATGEGERAVVEGSYIWETRSATVRPLEGFNSLDQDIFPPTGEIIMAGQVPDESGGQPYALTVFDPEINERPYPVYTEPGRGLFWPRYIQNGERVLVNSFTDRGAPRTQVIGRDGQVQAEWTAAQEAVISSLWGTAEGFAYTADNIDPLEGGTSTLYRVDAFTGLDAGNPLFTSEGSRVHIVWLRDDRLWAAPHPAWLDLNAAPQPTAIPTTTASAGPDSLPVWQLWVYEDSGRAIRINQDGQFLDTLLWPATESPDINPPSHLTASPDGRYLAGVLIVDGRPTYLQVYDTEADMMALTYRIPHDESTFIPSHTIERAPEHSIFNPSGTALAFGFGQGESGWQITVLDVAREEQLAILRHDSPTMLPLLTESGFGVVPVIQMVTDETVDFTIHPAGALEPPYASFRWHIQTGQVNPTLIYANPQNDTYGPTGEVIMAMIDDRLPNSADSFDYGQLNALHIYDPLTSTRYPFYYAEGLWLHRPIFIQNGERILVGGSGAGGTFTGWTVVERTGETSGILPINRTLWDQVGVGNGFVYIPRDDSTGTPELEVIYVNTRDGLDAGVLVLKLARSGWPQLVWADYAAQTPTLPTWAQLAPPVLAVGPVTTVSDERQLVASGQATVRTTNGDALQVRTGPGMGFSVATRLNSGTRVTLVDGPRRDIEGLTWWQIRTPSGVEGWVIEESEGVKTLVPD